MDLYVNCSVEQLADDFDELKRQDLHDVLVMIEIDGTARPIASVRRDTVRLPDGSQADIIVISGLDRPRLDA